MSVSGSEVCRAELDLGDLLSFILTCLSPSAQISWLLASPEWTHSLLSVVGVGPQRLPYVEALNPRLLALQLLTSVLPRRAVNSPIKQEVVSFIYCY